MIEFQHIAFGFALLAFFSVVGLLVVATIVRLLWRPKAPAPTPAAPAAPPAAPSPTIVVNPPSASAPAFPGLLDQFGAYVADRKRQKDAEDLRDKLDRIAELSAVIARPIPPATPPNP